MATKPNDKKLTFAEMTALATGELHALAKTVISPFSRLQKTTTEISEKIQFFGKVVAAMKRAYQAEVNAGDKLVKDMPFKKAKNGKRPGYFDMHAGGELPGRVEQLAELFNALVLGIGGKPLITEEDYDLCTAAWLEASNPIINEAMKQHGDNWKGSDDVLDVVNILTKRPSDGLKKLKAIRKRQKGLETEEGGDGENAGAGEVAALTVGRAVEFLKAAIKGAGQIKPEDAGNLYADIMSLGDAWAESGVDEATMERWANNVAHGVHPNIELKPAEMAA
jgi:hypothetical protein